MQLDIQAKYNQERKPEKNTSLHAFRYLFGQEFVPETTNDSHVLFLQRQWTLLVITQNSD